MSDCHEVRIHGVSGTPPDAMLDLDSMPIAHVGADESVGVYGPPPVAERPTEAYSWGKLTSAKPGTALYLLLLPFVLANVAGWSMQHPGAPRPRLDVTPRGPLVRAHVLTVRVAGVLLTALFVTALHLVLVDLVAWQWLAQREYAQLLGGEVPRAVLLGSGYAAVTALLGITWWSTRIRDVGGPPAHIDGTEWQDDRVDPTGSVWLDQDQRELWNNTGIVERLRAIHVIVGLSVLAALATYPTVDATGGWWLVVAPLVPAAGALALLTWISLGDGCKHSPLQPRTVVMTYIALGVTTVGVYGLALLNALRQLPAVGGGATAVPLDGPRGALAWGSAAYLAIILVVLIVQIAARRLTPGRRPPWRTCQTAPCMLLLAVALVAGLGVGLGLAFVRQVEQSEMCLRPTGIDCPIVLGTGVAWLAFGYLLWLAVLLLSAVGFYANAWRRMRSRDRGSRTMQALRYMTNEPATVLGWVFGTGIVVAVYLVVIWRLGTLDGRSLIDLPAAYLLPANLVISATAAALAAAVLAAFAGAFRAGGRWQRAGLAVGIIVVGVAGASGVSMTVLGIRIPPTSVPDVAVLVGLLAPVALLGTRIVAAFRDHEARRGVGVLWDLGLFWPRWFHPFAPPNYSDQAVSWLAQHVGHLLRTRADRVVLSAHSQGSLLAVAAIMLLSEDDGARTGLVTHGSPWGRLYGELFPAYFSHRTLRATLEQLGWTPGSTTVRWRNMHRATDPIGGPIAAPSQPWLWSSDLEEVLQVIDPDSADGRPDTADNDDHRIERPLMHSRYTLEHYYHARVDDVIAVLARPTTADAEQ